jgi:hypothetical protein
MANSLIAESHVNSRVDMQLHEFTWELDYVKRGYPYPEYR